MMNQVVQVMATIKLPAALNIALQVVQLVLVPILLETAIKRKHVAGNPQVLDRVWAAVLLQL